MKQATETRPCDRLIADFAGRVSGVTHATVVSADGFLLAASPGLPEDKADQVAAVASGLNSLTRGAARIFDGGPVAQTVMEMANGYLFLMGVPTGPCLAVLGSAQADLGLVVYEMTLLADRVAQEVVVAQDVVAQQAVAPAPNGCTGSPW